MPDPLLSELTPAPETKAFRAVVDILQADDVLSRVITAWDVFDGEHETVEPPGRNQLPWLRLMPGPSQLGLADSESYELQLNLYASLATRGLHADDHLNLWGAFRLALRAQKPFRGTTVQRHLRTNGVTVHMITSPGFAPYAAPSPDRPSRAIDLFGAARIVLDMIVPY